MKSHTDLPQSRTLAEILPHDTADQSYERFVIAGAGFNIPDEKQCRHNGDMPFRFYSGIGLPCWSLAALLNILPNNQGRYTKSLYWFDDAWLCEYVDEDGVGILGTSADNALDACYEMILKLHEKKLL